MLKIEDVLQVQDGETIQEIVRRHWLTLVPQLALAFVLIVVPFFFLFPLFAWGIIGVTIFIVALLLGITIAMRAFLLWDANVVIVTTLRVVDVSQRGVFTRIVSDIALTSIQDSSWMRRGILQTLFSFGTVRIETMGTQGGVCVERIANPERLSVRLTELRHARQPSRPDLSPERRQQLKKITTMLESFSAEELTRIEAILKARVREAATDAFLTQDESVKT